MAVVNAILTFLLAIGCTILCIALLKPVAPIIGLVDEPSARKNHEGAIPVVGGIAIWITFGICLLYIGMTTQMMFFLVAGGILTLVGAIDDATELSPVWRLVLHIVAALVICVFGGAEVQNLGELILPGVEVLLGPFSILFTVFAIVALVNAVNMSDGLDGLCAMQVLVPLAGLAVLAGLFGDSDHFLPLVAICGCLVGFLYFNLRAPWRARATVFLGDAGSNLLGIILAGFLISMSQGPQAILVPVAALWFAILLIYDTVEVVARRVVRRKSAFAPDREHLHHVFLLANFSVSETVMTMSAITLIGVFIGIVPSIIAIPDNALFGAFVLFGLLFLRMIFRTWAAMQFLYRSICRRRGDRRKSQAIDGYNVERRGRVDRRSPDNQNGD